MQERRFIPLAKIGFLLPPKRAIHEGATNMLVKWTDYRVAVNAQC